jgi:hypothetical protein
MATVAGKTIYDLKLHEKLVVDDETSVLAVHNGWIYIFTNAQGNNTSCYVTSTKRGRPEGSSSKGSDETESSTGTEQQ